MKPTHCHFCGGIEVMCNEAGTVFDCDSCKKRYSVVEIITGDEIRNARNKKGISQEVAAMAIGVACYTYQRYEYGVIVPAQENLEKLKKALDL